MKKLLILCILSIQLSDCFSQITITYQQIIQPNDDVYRTDLDTTSFNEGGTGNNLIWDYSKINVLQYNSYHVKYLPTNGSSCFFDSTINLETYSSGGNTTSYEYFISDSTQFGYKGSCTETGFMSGRSQYEDYSIKISLPFNYLDTFNDESVGSWQGGDPVCIGHIKGSSNMIYDAWGELKLPWGNYHNVARVKTQSFRKDSVASCSSNVGEVRISTYTTYEWYDLNNHGSILVYSFGYYTVIPIEGNTTTTFGKSVSAVSNTPVEVKELLGDYQILTVYPNPSKSELIIKAKPLLKSDEKLSLVINNSLGQIVAQGMVKIVDGIINLSIEILPIGIYHLSLSNGEKIYHANIIKE
jgi:hypothetical protein